jgi:hypothetical protein
VAPYGDDITEGLPHNLSNPVSLATFTSNGEAYDMAINGQPFFMYTNDETPYRRQTAAYRKQQIDQSNEPGEQTLTGWWIRSQSSFHGGAGIKYYDPSIGETVAYRFTDSRGVNIWDKGKLTLLRSCTQGHTVTTSAYSTGRVAQHMRTIEWSGTGGILLLDGYDVDKIDNNGTVTHFIDYNAGAGVYPVYSVCDDGTYAYWITNATSGGTTKLTMYKKPLTGSASNTADEVKMFDATGIISNAVMEYVKERIILCADNKVYEIAPAATVLPTAIYTHPSSTYTFTSVSASGAAIYVSGFNGNQSSIFKFTLDTAGALPTLTSGIVAAEFPRGEVVHKIMYYLGYMLIGTSKGIRIAVVSDNDGSINYGPLVVETSQPCYDFATKDRFVWCATGVAGSPGLIRIDLGYEVSTLRFAYANDVYYPSATGHKTTACAFIDGTDRIAFCSQNQGGTDGYVYIESASTLISSGYIQTGNIRYATVEGKVFKILKARIDNAYGALTMSSIDYAGNEYVVGTFAEGDFTPEVSVNYPQGAQEYLSFKFTMSRFTTDTTKGPTFTGYQLKALPAVPRQRIVQFPLACYDREMDKFGVQIGYEGRAYDRLYALESLESAGDSVRVEDFRTGESFIGLIEEVSFINRTSSDKRFSGFGGVATVSIRTL